MYPKTKYLKQYLSRNTGDSVTFIYKKYVNLNENNIVELESWEGRSCAIWIIRLIRLLRFTDAKVTSLRKFHQSESTGVK